MLVLYTPVIKRLAKKTETALQSAYRETSISFDIVRNGTMKYLRMMN